MSSKREVAGFQESQHSLHRLNLLTLLPLVWNIWIFNLNPFPQNSWDQHSGKEKEMGAGIEADGCSGWGRLWAARGHHEATACPEGRGSETRVGKFREVVAKQLCLHCSSAKGPGRCPACLQKPSSMLSAVNCWCLNIDIRITWSSKNLSVPQFGLQVLEFPTPASPVQPGFPSSTPHPSLLGD